MTDSRTDGQTDDRRTPGGKTICLPTLKGGDIILFFFFLFHRPPVSPLNIICFVEKDNIFLRFCLCIFESDTVKSDCNIQIFRKMMKYLYPKYGKNITVNQQIKKNLA